MKKILIAVVIIASLGGSYYLGTRTTSAVPESVPQQAQVTQSIVDDLVVPTGLTIPAQLPAMKIDEPSKVLAGEVKVPVDLLRVEPPAAQPNLIIPMITK